jgi:hypothetical protein
VGRAIRRASLLVVAGSVAACWLTSSFDGLLATGTGMTADASEPGDAGLDGRIVTLDGSPEDSAADTGRADAPVPPDSAPATDSATTTDAPADTLAPGDAGCMTDAYVTSVMGDHPLGYYRLDEQSGATVAADMSGNHYDGVYQNVTSVAGAIKSDLGDMAASFNGSTSIVTVAGTQFSFTGMAGLAPFSVEAWVNPSTISGEFRGVLSNESVTNNPRYGYLIYLESPADSGVALFGFERWTGDASTPAQFTSPLAMTMGSWSYLVGIFDPTQSPRMRFYLNGGPTPAGSNNALPHALTQTEAFVIGALYGGSTTNPSTFSGAIDEVAVYNHALDPTCVAYRYHLGSGM